MKEFSRIDIIASNGNEGLHYETPHEPIGRKLDNDKPRYNLLPAIAIDEMAKVMTFGAKKYAPDDWRRVPEGERRYLAALLRHAFAISKGEINDHETGLPHAAHVMCCAAFLIELNKSA